MTDLGTVVPISTRVRAIRSSAAAGVAIGCAGESATCWSSNAAAAMRNVRWHRAGESANCRCDCVGQSETVQCLASRAPAAPAADRSICVAVLNAMSNRTSVSSAGASDRSWRRLSLSTTRRRSAAPPASARSPPRPRRRGATPSRWRRDRLRPRRSRTSPTSTAPQSRGRRRPAARRRQCDVISTSNTARSRERPAAAERSRPSSETEPHEKRLDDRSSAAMRAVRPMRDGDLTQFQSGPAVGDESDAASDSECRRTTSTSGR
jgi:hypothetical protein